MLSPAHGRRADDETPFMLFVRRVNVRFWHKADITRVSSNVRFWGNADILPADLDGRSGYRPDEDAHMGGLIPLRPTVMFDATIVPSGSLSLLNEPIG